MILAVFFYAKIKLLLYGFGAPQVNALWNNSQTFASKVRTFSSTKPRKRAAVILTSLLWLLWTQNLSYEANCCLYVTEHKLQGWRL